MIQEKVFKPSSGWLYLFSSLGLLISGVVLFAYWVMTHHGPPPVWLFGCLIFSILFGVLGLCGLIAVQPNAARVLLLFGEYRGTAKDSGFFWVNPFFSKKKISLRVRNFETGSTIMAEKKNEVGQVTQPAGHTSGKTLEGERQGRQPDRDIGRCRLESCGYCRSDV